MMRNSENTTAPAEATGKTRGDESSSYVLVVDDEPVVREFMARCLQGWGYAVKEAAGADEALDLMVARPASVVLVDVKMPGHDGFWLAERLRADWPGTPVVMASGVDDLQTIRHSRDLGAVDYITKPITPSQLREVLRRVTMAGTEDKLMADDPAAPPIELPPSRESQAEAEYTLESPVRCPACGERMTSVKAIRLVRAHVNFTSTLPRRGRVIVCPHCLAVIPAELSNF
jgi:CheY-like chemotaxis protein/DNA-directed RNA polymerase subunit RPC12/RpoP